MPRKLEKFGPLLGWLALALGIALRLYHLGTSSLDIDEMVSVGFAHHESWRGLMSDTNPPLFLLLLRGWIQIFPPTEFWLRFPSFVFSVASLILMSRIGWIPTLLLALTPASVQAAQWCRGNSLWEFATVLSLYGLLKSQRLTSLTGLVIASLTHWFATFINVGTVSLGIKTKSNLWRAGLISLLALIFFAAVFAGLQRASFHLDWQIMRFRGVPLLTDAKQQLIEICGGWAVALMIIFFLGWNWKNNFKENNRASWSICLSLIFGLLLIVLSLSTERSLFLSRYMTPFVPLFAWSGAVLIVNAPTHRVVRLMATAFWVGCLLLGTKAYFDRPTPRWRDALKKAVELQVKTLWTTRPVGIAHPYLQDTDVRVRNFQGTRINTEDLIESLKLGRTAIIENYWGGLLYLAPTREYLHSRGFKTEELVYSEGTDEPLQLLIIDP